MHRQKNAKRCQHTTFPAQQPHPKTILNQHDPKYHPNTRSHNQVHEINSKQNAVLVPQGQARFRNSQPIVAGSIPVPVSLPVPLTERSFRDFAAFYRFRSTLGHFTFHCLVPCCGRHKYLSPWNYRSIVQSQSFPQSQPRSLFVTGHYVCPPRSSARCSL